MAKRVQIIGNTTAATATFVGLAREVTVDTDLNELIVHTGGGAGTQKRVPNKDTNDTLYAAASALLTAYVGLSATGGLVAKTGAASVAARTLTGTANQLTVTNGDGASGNPTISLPAAVTMPGSLTVSAGNDTVLSTTQVSLLTASRLATLSGGLVVTGTAGSTFSTTQIGMLGSTQVGGNVTAQINALGSITGTNTVDLTLGCDITATQNASALTIVFSGYKASGKQSWTMSITLDSTPHSVTFQRSSGNAVSWDSTVGAPTLVASKKLVVYFQTEDAGTTVLASFIGQY